jgi:hypothetical protein
MPNAVSNALLQSSMETRMWLVSSHVVSCRNYLGGTHLEIYLDSDLVHCVPTLPKRVRRKILLPLRDDFDPTTDVGAEDGARVLTLTVSSKSDSLSPAYEYELWKGPARVRIPQHYDPCSGWDPRVERLPGLEHCVSIPAARLGSEMRDGPGMEGVVLYKLRIEPFALPGGAQPTGGPESEEGDEMALEPAAAMARPIGGEGVCVSSLEPYAEWKRYNDFDELYTLVHSAYSYYPFDKLNVPKPPGKTLRKRADSDFIESRRAALEGFLKGLLRLTRISYNPDLLRFLGARNSQRIPFAIPFVYKKRSFYRGRLGTNAGKALKTKRCVCVFTVPKVSWTAGATLWAACRMSLRHSTASSHRSKTMLTMRSSPAEVG